jgi:hypothetical protein
MAAISSTVPIDVFYTICTDYDYAFVIFAEQMARLESSGLAGAMRSLTITLAGDRSLVYNDLPFADKIKILPAPIAKEGEFYTLFEILRRAQEEDFYALYFHAKGCTHGPDNHNIKDWRELMEYFLLDQWSKAVEALKTNDTVGVNNSTWPVPHYSGNFWWARSAYLRHLPNPRDHYLAFYTEFTTNAESEKHQHWLAECGFDEEFVRLTYTASTNLPILPNLQAFIREYGFDWLWYTRHIPTAIGLSAEEAINHRRAQTQLADADYAQFYRIWQRINTEAWIQRNGGRHLSLYNSNRAHYNELCPAEIYKTAGRKKVALFFPYGEEPHERYLNTSDIEYRVFINLSADTHVTSRRARFGRYWHVNFSQLTTPEQLLALEAYLRNDPDYNEVIVVKPETIMRRRALIAQKLEHLVQTGLRRQQRQLVEKQKQERKAKIMHLKQSMRKA